MSNVVFSFDAQVAGVIAGVDAMMAAFSELESAAESIVSSFASIASQSATLMTGLGALLGNFGDLADSMQQGQAAMQGAGGSASNLAYELQQLSERAADAARAHQEMVQQIQQQEADLTESYKEQVAQRTETEQESLQKLVENHASAMQQMQDQQQQLTNSYEDQIDKRLVAMGDQRATQHQQLVNALQQQIDALVSTGHADQAKGLEDQLTSENASYQKYIENTIEPVYQYLDKKGYDSHQLALQRLQDRLTKEQQQYNQQLVYLKKHYDAEESTLTLHYKQEEQKLQEHLAKEDQQYAEQVQRINEERAHLLSTGGGGAGGAGGSPFGLPHMDKVIELFQQMHIGPDAYGSPKAVQILQTWLQGGSIDGVNFGRGVDATTQMTLQQAWGVITQGMSYAQDPTKDLGGGNNLINVFSNLMGMSQLMNYGKDPTVAYNSLLSIFEKAESGNTTGLLRQLRAIGINPEMLAKYGVKFGGRNGETIENPGSVLGALEGIGNSPAYASLGKNLAENTPAGLGNLMKDWWSGTVNQITGNITDPHSLIARFTAELSKFVGFLFQHQGDIVSFGKTVAEWLLGKFTGFITWIQGSQAKTILHDIGKGFKEIGDALHWLGQHQGVLHLLLALLGAQVGGKLLGGLAGGIMGVGGGLLSGGPLGLLGGLLRGPAHAAMGGLPGLLGGAYGAYAGGLGAAGRGGMGLLGGLWNMFGPLGHGAPGAGGAGGPWMPPFPWAGGGGGSPYGGGPAGAPPPPFGGAGGGGFFGGGAGGGGISTMLTRILGGGGAAGTPYLPNTAFYPHTPTGVAYPFGTSPFAAFGTPTALGGTPTALRTLLTPTWLRTLLPGTMLRGAAGGAADEAQSLLPNTLLRTFQPATWLRTLLPNTLLNGGNAGAGLEDLTAIRGSGTLLRTLQYPTLLRTLLPQTLLGGGSGTSPTMLRGNTPYSSVFNWFPSSVLGGGSAAGSGSTGMLGGLFGGGGAGGGGISTMLTQLLGGGGAAAGGAAGAAGGGGGIMGMLAGGIGPMLAGIGPALLGIAAAAGPILLLVGAIAGLVAILVINKDKIMPFIHMLMNFFGGQLKQAEKAINDFVHQVESRLGPAFGPGSLVYNGIMLFAHLWAAMWPGIELVFKGVWNVIAGVIKVAWSIVSGIILIGLDILGGKWGLAWKDLGNLLHGVWNGILQILKGLVQILGGILLGFFAGLWNLITGPLLSLLGNVLKFFLWTLPTGILHAILTLELNMIMAVVHLVQAVGKGFHALWGIISGDTKKAAIDAAMHADEMKLHQINAAQKSAEGVIMHMRAQKTGLLRELEETKDPVKRHALEMQIAQIDAAEATAEQTIKKSQEQKLKVIEHMKELAAEAKHHADLMKLGVIGHVIEMTEDFTKFVGGIWGNITGKLNDLKTKLIIWITTALLGMMSKLTDFGNGVGDFFTKTIPDKLKGLWGAILGTIKSIIDNLVNTVLPGPLQGPVHSALGFAQGGHYPGSAISIVGEAGPELFFSEHPGAVVSNSQIRDALLGSASGGGGLSPIIITGDVCIVANDPKDFYQKMNRHAGRKFEHGRRGSAI